jgi:hypothetical protein
MGNDGIMGFLNVNRSLTNLGDESRRLRLPTVSPFPKLNQRIVQSTDAGGQQVKPACRPATRSAVVIEAPAGSLPEMATDVMGVAAGYAVENVKRDRSSDRPWLGQLMGRVLGSHHRAARL